jgi:hypothetical protein
MDDQVAKKGSLVTGAVLGAGGAATAAVVASATGAGTMITVAAPIVALLAVGYGFHRLMKRVRSRP